MRNLIYACVVLTTLAACGSSKNYLERSDQDKALQDAIKKLNKSPDDENALSAVPVLYSAIAKNHVAKVQSLRNSKNIERWDKILGEYNALQKAYDAIIESPPAFKLITPVSYSAEILETKQSAAEEYYRAANDFLSKEGRSNAKKSYTYFKKADKYIPGYKDSQVKMKQAYDNALVDVVIHPVQDNSFFFNSGWGNAGYNYSNEYFQQTLVRDLGGTDNLRYPARFYTEWEARRDNIKPDWVVELRLRNLDIPYPSSHTYRRNVSSQIQIGTDTSGRPVYNSVYATVNVTRSSFTAWADMEVSIKEVSTGKNIRYNSYRDDFRWEEERATYSGDSRALSSHDWQLINSYGYNTPTKEYVLNELYRELYPKVKNDIIYAVDW